MNLFRNLQWTIFLLLVLICLPITGYTQDSTQVLPKKDTVYQFVEQMPQFPDGKPQKWIITHASYPVEALQAKLTGKVFVQFIIEKDSTLSNIRVLKSSGHKILDDEGLRIISSMPKWIPGKQKDTCVRVAYTLPINFMQAKPPMDTTTSKNGMAPDAPFRADVMPFFTGGNVQKWISRNIVYPKEELANTTEGKVFIQFIIEKDGSIGPTQVIRSSGNINLDKEAIRTIKSMPKWIPGSIKGITTRVSYTLPINFKLMKESENNFPTFNNFNTNGFNPNRQ